jgi:DNA-directed RNA polymerase subunit RPC12/RpoP
MGEGESQKRPSAEIKTRGICSRCGRPVAEQGKAPGNFCQFCGAKLRKMTEMLTSQGGKVVFKGQGEISKSAGSEVEPDPVGSHDFSALEAALGGTFGVKGETKKDWDPEIARVIDVRGKQPQGLVKKKQK